MSIKRANGIKKKNNKKKSGKLHRLAIADCGAVHTDTADGLRLYADEAKGEEKAKQLVKWVLA